MTGPRALRRVVRWSLAALLPGELVLVVCVLSGVRIPPPARLAAELVVLAVLVATGTLLARDHRRHRRAGLGRRAALGAAVADTVPAAVRRLTAHEIHLSACFLRWIARRGPHGVREGDVPVPYASGQAAVMFCFLFASVLETVVLALLIPWPVVHLITLVVGVWGVYFVLALHASCVVRPHVVGADGSLRLRYGALLDVRIPAGRVAAARVDRRFPGSRPGAVDADGVAELAVGSQTTVTVELTGPVAFTRPLGRVASAGAFRLYAEDPAATVAALRARAGLDRV
ncbi:hypothetical protein [Streptomyces mayteni]